MSTMHQSDDNKFIPMTSLSAGQGHEVRSDVYYYTNQIVNVIFVGDPDGTDWVLIDAGMPKSGSTIMEIASKRFPKNSRPSAIILTHGHFDHVGGIVHLIENWKVPVYAHPLEIPFLNGQQAYPEPDSTVDGGLLAKISSIYPNEPIDITSALAELPTDGSLPNMPGWRWVHTPGHSPGHISIFRDADRTLIAGDAFVTVRADSFYKVLVQKKEVNGPPRYLTTDWKEAKASVLMCEAMQPEFAITGHGKFMSGPELRSGLRELAERFEELAVPEHGKYV